jgi:hypothetical protein
MWLYRSERVAPKGILQYYQQEWGWNSFGFSRYQTPSKDIWSIMIGPWIWVIPYK